MKQLRFWLLGTLIWFIFVYNLERFGNLAGIAPFVINFSIGCAILVLLVDSLNQLPFYWIGLLSLPLYFSLKVVLGYKIGIQDLPLTITEICIIGITIFLPYQVGRRLEVFRQAISSLTIDHLYSGTHSFETGQGQIYREIRRARRYRRSAALLAISIEEDSLKFTLNRFVEEAQNELVRKFAIGRLADLLVKELQDTDVIAQRNNHFIALLPEASRENVFKIASRLENVSREKLGVALRIGLATFPDEAVTFESLLERAEAKMNDVLIESNSQVLSTSSSTKSVPQL